MDKITSKCLHNEAYSNEHILYPIVIDVHCDNKAV